MSRLDHHLERGKDIKEEFCHAIDKALPQWDM